MSMEKRVRRSSRAKLKGALRRRFGRSVSPGAFGAVTKRGRPPSAGQSLVGLVAVFAALTMAVPAHGQGRAQLRLAVVDARSELPVAGVLVTEIASGASGETDALGRLDLDIEAGEEARLQFRRYGYVPLDTTLAVPHGDVPVKIELQPTPERLTPITARVSHRRPLTLRERADIEVSPRLAHLDAWRIETQPAFGEPDVLRAVQATPGVVARNELSAGVHVDGGAADQTAILFDGVRVFAPYHLFGMLGAFNSHTVAGADLYRGALPARYGGALSSVLSIEQHDAAEPGVEPRATLSLVGASASLKWGSRDAQSLFMVSGRRTWVDALMESLTGTRFPYSFWDVQGKAVVSPAPGHRVAGSVFATNDRYGVAPSASTSLRSHWTNRVASVQWEWELQPREGRTLRADVWTSRYRNIFRLGQDASPHLESRIGLNGGRLEWSWEQAERRVRIGISAEDGPVSLIGSEEPGSYVEGRADRRHRAIAAFGDLGFVTGSIRWSPGLRLTWQPEAERWLFEPRVGARHYVSDRIWLSLGVAHTEQTLSTVQDDRHVLLGAPLWFSHPETEPASASTSVGLTASAWLDGGWDIEAGIQARRLTDVVRWRPEGDRTLERVAYDDGHAIGADLRVRFAGNQLTASATYRISRVVLREGDTGVEYNPTWDRRHSLDVTGAWLATSRLRLSGRVVYGSGTPFWPMLGYAPVPRLNTLTSRVERELDFAPVYSQEQLRLPALFRLDFSASYALVAGAVRIEWFANILNATARPNVLYYELVDASNLPGSPYDDARLVPVTTSPVNVIPSVGFDVRF